MGFMDTLNILAQQEAKSFVEAGNEQDEITVLLFTSFVPSHPNTFVLEKTYASIRQHLPKSKIVILADGVAGTEHPFYTQFKQKVRDKNWDIIEFSGKHHQTLMLRHALLTEGVISTPLVMVGEHDWGIRKLYVGWQLIVASLLDPSFPFSFIQIRQDCIGKWEIQRNFFRDVLTYNGLNFLPTSCFQTPVHIARVDQYRKIIAPVSRPEFLERDSLFKSLALSKADQEMACYIPDGPIGRLYHLDGRNVTRLSQIADIGG